MSVQAVTTGGGPAMASMAQASREPRLALELIQKAVQALDAGNMQSPVRPVAETTGPRPASGRGVLLDTHA